MSQAGVVDLTAAYDQDLGGGAVAALMGSAPDDPDYDLADPMRHVPLDVPAWLVHAADDPVVPIGQSGTTSPPPARPAPRPSWSRSRAATSG